MHIVCKPMLTTNVNILKALTADSGDEAAAAAAGILLASCRRKI